MSNQVGSENDSAELVAFREEWLAELRQRRSNSVSSNADIAGTADHSDPASSSVAALSPDSVDTNNVKVSRPSSHHTKATQSTTEVITKHSLNSTHISQTLRKALEVYKLAITSESTGNVTEALNLYRRAFRLDSNVDKAYRREELRLASVSESAPAPRIQKSHPETRIEGTVTEVEKTPISHIHTTSIDKLAKIISSFPNELGYEPEDEKKTIPLKVVPDELLVLILMFLDPLSIERFAVVNRKTRILTLDQSLWKDLVQRTYVSPQISNDLSIELIAKQHDFDYRRLYIEYPRVRLDGVYIAVCHYVRPGMGENAWINVDHLITYHRYLRFFPDGTVLSLLANEEVEPQSIIPLLKPSLRMKGLYIGSWYLEEKTVIIQELTDPSGHNTRYTFQMTLSLRSKPLGRWNKLDFVGYDSVNIETGEVVPLTMKHERGYWFSKVRSYLA